MKLLSLFILSQLFFVPLADARRVKGARDLSTEKDETQYRTYVEDDGCGKGGKGGKGSDDRRRRRLNRSSSKGCSIVPSSAPSVATANSTFSNDIEGFLGGRNLRQGNEKNE